MTKQKINEYCVHCGKIIPEEKRKYLTIKYCGKICKHRAATARHYEKYKKDLIFMDNRRQDQKRIRKERQEKGLCPRCKQEMLYETTIYCSNCYVSRKSRER
jgi:hypothetical protein